MPGQWMFSAVVGERIPIAPLQAVSRNLFNGTIIPLIQCGLPAPVIFSAEILAYRLDTDEVIISGGLFKGTWQTSLVLKLMFPLVCVLKPATGGLLAPGRHRMGPILIVDGDLNRMEQRTGTAEATRMRVRVPVGLEATAGTTGRQHCPVGILGVSRV